VRASANSWVRRFDAYVDSRERHLRLPTALRSGGAVATVERRGRVGSAALPFARFFFLVRGKSRRQERFIASSPFATSLSGPWNFVELVYLPNDHTAGGRAGMGTPTAYMADNDLALGRMVETLSHSPYWKDTVMFVLEDDSQAGPDHVDSHRGPLLVISAYSRPGTIHRFANTTDVLGAIEDILKMGRLSKYDYFSRSLADVFVSKPDLRPYSAITPEASLDEKNPEKTKASELSKHLDLSAPDRIDDALFNSILWAMLKPDQPMPRTESKAEVHLMQITR
jgi:hypothetical protein